METGAEWAGGCVFAPLGVVSSCPSDTFVLCFIPILINLFVISTRYPDVSSPWVAFHQCRMLRIQPCCMPLKVCRFIQGLGICWHGSLFVHTCRWMLVFFRYFILFHQNIHRSSHPNYIRTRTHYSVCRRMMASGVRLNSSLDPFHME